MIELPAPLAPSLVRSDHSSLELRIEPVFTPVPWAARLLLAPFLPMVLFLLVQVMSHSQLYGALLFGALLVANLAAGTAHKNRRPALQVRLAATRLELSSELRQESMLLAEVQSVTVAEEALSLRLWSGRTVSVPFPERSSAIRQALQDFLRQAVQPTQPEPVPEQLRRLVKQGDYASR